MGPKEGTKECNKNTLDWIVTKSKCFSAICNIVNIVTFDCDNENPYKHLIKWYV